MSFGAPVPIGDDLLSVNTETAERAQAVAEHLRASGGWREVVAGLDSVVVQFDLLAEAPVAARARLQDALQGTPSRMTGSGEIVEIPLRYGGVDGPDLEALCEGKGMSAEHFVELHSNATYRVEMIGFTPGFAYCSGLDARLESARRSTPRTHVPAGSVGIGGSRTGIYALEGPGGWQIIGRTSLTLFDGAAREPFLLRPSQRVRFVAL